MELLMIAIALWLGHYFGYSQANHDIALECERLGGFFVGKKVFKCTEIIPADQPISTNDKSESP